MKRALICALLTLAMAAPGTALYAQAQQDNGQGGGRAHGMQMSPDQRMQHMTKMLNLSADQQEKIKPILESESQQMQTLHQDTSLTREQRFDKMREIRENTMTQIKPILSADQQAKWEQMRRKPMPPEAGQGSQQSAPPPQASPY